MNVHTVQGGGGVRLQVREWGSPSGRPILLIHGWSQNHLCWMMQSESKLLERFRMVAFDLRGHGESEAPSHADAYTSGDVWADDIAEIIRGLRLEKPVLVGWSYGGFVIGDYLRKYGQKEIASVGFVAGAVVLGAKAFGTLIGPGFLENAPSACALDVATNQAAMRRFVRACIVKPIPQKVFDAVLEFNMLVSPQVRGFLIQRELDFTDALEQLTRPVLVTQGRADTVVLPAMSEYIVNHCRGAQISWFDEVGHAPFLEAPERFDRELATFASC